MKNSYLFQTRIFLVLVFLGSSLSFSRAQTTRWIGTLNNNWNNSTNWDNGIPTSTSQVLISNLGTSPVISSAVSIQSLQLETGSQLALNSGSLAITNDFINQGTFSFNGGTMNVGGNLQNDHILQLAANRTLQLAANLQNDGTLNISQPSTIQMNGTGNHSITGNNSILFSNLIINKSAGGSILLQKDAQILDNLTISQGNLQLDLNVVLALEKNLTNNGMLISANPSTIRLQGAGNHTISGTGISNFDLLEINKTLGNIQINQDISIHQSCTIPAGVTMILGASRRLSLDDQLINQGTVDLNSTGNTLVFGGNSLINLAGSGLSNFQNLEINKTGAGQLVVDANISIHSNLIITQGTLQLNSGFNMSLLGNLQSTGTFLTQNNSTFTLQGTGNQSIQASALLNIYELILDKSTGNLNIQQSISLTADFTVPTGLTCNLASGTTLSLGNNLINNGNFLASTGSTVQVSGTSTNTFSGTNALGLDLLQISKSSGSVLIDLDLSLNQTLTIPSGILFSIQPNRRLTCNQLIVNQGTFDSSQPGSTLVFAGTSNISIASTGINTFRNLEIAKSGAGSVSIDQSITILEDFNLTSGTTTLNAFITLSLSGSLTNFATLTAAGSSTVELFGTGTNFLDGTQALTLGQLVINKTSGNVEIGLNLSMTNNFTIPVGVSVILKSGFQISIPQNFLNNGTLNAASNSVFEIRGTGLSSIGGTSPSNFYTLKISKTSGSIILSQNIKVITALTIPTGISTTLSAGFLLELENNFTANGTFSAASTSSLRFSGSTTSVISGSSSLNIGSLIINKSGAGAVNCQLDMNVNRDFSLQSGSFTLQGGRRIRLSGNFLANGTFTAQSGSIFEVTGTATNLFNGTSSPLNFDSFQITKTGGTIEFDTDINIVQDLSIPTGVTLRLNTGRTLSLSKNLINQGTFDNTPINHTITFNGNTNASISGSGIHAFRNLVIQKSGGASFTVNAPIRIYENLNVSSGGLVLGSGQQISLYGNFTNNGALFNAPSPSTFEFAGNANQTLDGSFNFYFRTTNVSKSSGTVTFNRDVLFYEDLHIPTGVNFTLNSSEFKLDGNLIMDGTIMHNAGIFELGGSTITTVTGSSTPTFYDLVIDKDGSTAEVTFMTDLIVARNFRALDGIMNLGAGRTMTVFEDFRRDNTGIFNALSNSTVVFTGDLISSIFTSSVVFENLTVNKTALNPATNVQASVRIDNNITISVNKHLELTRGRIITSYSNNRLLILGNAATSSSATVDSFVDGPMRKIGNTAFIFPVGKDGRPGRIAITPTVAGANSDYFTAEYFATTFGNSALNSPPLGDASDREFWRLERNGSTTVSVRLYWEYGTSSGLNGPSTSINPALLKIGQWNDVANIWETRDGFNLNGAFNGAGYLESAPGQNTFGQYRHWTFVYEENNYDWGIVTWIGEIDSNWHNRLNWSPAEVPTALNDVWLIGDRPFYPVIDTANAIAKSMNISPDISPGVQASVLPSLTVNDTLEVVGSGAGGEINCSGMIFNHSLLSGAWRLTLQDEGEIQNQGIIRMQENFVMNNNAQLHNEGEVYAVDFQAFNNSVVINDSLMYLSDDMELRNSHQFTNNHTLIILDEIFGRDNALLTNLDSVLVHEKITLSNNFILDNHQRFTTGFARTGTLTLSNNSRINNTSTGILEVLASPSPGSIVLSSTASLINQGLVTCGLDFQISSTTASVSNDNLIQIRRNFENNGLFSGNGTLEFYDNSAATSRIYGTANPAFSHRLILSKTSGTLQTEQNIEVTDDLIIPASYTLSVFPNMEVTLLGNFVNDGILNAQTGSEFIFSGANSVEVSGNQSITFYNLTQQKSGSASTTINRPIRVAGDLNNNTGTLDIPANRSIQIFNGGDLNNDATIHNLGTLSSDGFLYNNAGATLDNSDTITVYQNENRGTLINQTTGRFTANYRTNNRSSGLINNNGYYYSAYYHDNRDNSQVVNSGTLSNALGIYSYDNSQVINNIFGLIATGSADYGNRNNSSTQNFGTINSGRHLELLNNGQFVNSGTVLALQNIQLRDQSLLTNHATMTANLDISIQGNSQFINNNLVRLQDDFENQKTFSGSGTIEFFGNNASSRIFGINPVFSHQVIITKTGGQIEVENNLVITNTLTNPVSHSFRIVNGTVTLEQSLVNHGNFQGDTDTGLTFSQSANAGVSGNGTTSVYDLNIQKTGGALVSLDQELTVNRNFNNLSGHFRLNNGIFLNIGGNITNNTILEALPNSTLTLFGNSASIGGSSPLEFYNVLMDKDGLASVILNRELSIQQGGHLTLTSGLITTSVTSLLVLQDDASSSPGSNASFVNGPMRKIGDDPFVFPVGKGTKWARIEVSDLNLGNTNDYFDAQYFPFGYGNYTRDNTLNNVSLLEYWDLSRGNILSGSGTTEAKVSIYWEDPSFTDLVDVAINDLRVAHFESGNWTDKGGVVTGNLSNGKITTDFHQNSFSPWTFASETGVNPLPITLISFEARKTSEQQVQLTWATSSEVNASHFEIQRSNDALSFESLARVNAQGNSHSRLDYAYPDQNPLPGINYYRLKIIDRDGSYAYSPIRSVRLEGEVIPEISRLFPNPFVTDLNIELRLNANESYQIRLVDLLGREVFYKAFKQTNDDLTKLRLELANLTNGTYLLTLEGKHIKITKRVVKE